MAEPSFLEVLQWSDTQCRDYLESKRWPDGPVCPKCGHREYYTINRKSKTKNKVTKIYRCKNKECRKDFTCTVGTIFEDTKLPLNIWFAAIHAMCSSKKGVSANQIHRMLKIDLKSAWYLCHRVREAMKEKNPTLLTGIVEADETYIGGKPRGHAEHIGKGMTRGERMKASWDRKTPVFGILERGGRVRSKAVPGINKAQAQEMLSANIDLPKAMLMTDEHPMYQGIINKLPHGVIKHKSEYVRGGVHTQGIESYWAILKRGLYGTFHHVDAGYLGQYLYEFEYRYNARKTSDAERFAALMGQTQGRVLWFCQTEQPENPFA